MTDGQLAGARIDILEVLAIQEKSERTYPGTCPKIGAYWDELYTVNEELARRTNRAELRRGMAETRRNLTAIEEPTT